MKTICFLTMNFHYSSKPGKPIKPIVFFNNFVFTKIHLQNRSHFFALRISFFDRSPLFLFMVPSDFNIFFVGPFIYVYLSIANCATHQVTKPIFRPHDKTYCKTTAALRILTKRIVRLRCRCSCKMCSTSAVPLLVIHETSVKPD